MKKVLYLAMLISVLTACSKSSEEIEATDDNYSGGLNTELAAAEDYFNNTLKSVITDNCVSCHSGYHSGNNTRNYSVFSNARSLASRMYSMVDLGSMPQDASRLPQAEVDKFKKFLDLVSAIK